jgi:hypothetical protein
MSKTEKVRIDLPSKNPPVKQCKIRNQRPVSGNFKLVPKYMPFLTQFVSDVAWNCQEKTVEFNITETARFDAYNWFGGINKRFTESQKSSFVDLEQDSLLLVLMDECDKEVVNIKFRGLSLANHHCYFARDGVGGFGIDSPSNEPLTHFVRLVYSDSETIAPAHVEDEFELKIMSPEQKNEFVDEEWQESTCNCDENVAVS